MISPLFLWNVFKAFIANPVGYAPGYEDYLESGYYLLFSALFLTALWNIYKEHPFGIIGAGLRGSDHEKSTSLTNVWLGLLLLFAAHLGLNVYSTLNKIPAEVAQSQKSDLSIAQINDIAALAHKHHVTLGKVCSIDMKNMGIYVIGSKRSADLYISESWLTSEVAYEHFLILLERNLIRLSNNSELKANLIQSSLFGLSAIILAHLYIFPLTCILALNHLMYVALFAPLAQAGTKYIWSHFYYAQTLENDRETAAFVGPYKLQATLKYFDKQIHYDQAIAHFPSWKICIPPFSERIARLRENSLHAV